MNSKKYTIVFSLCLILFSVYFLLNTFVFGKKYKVVNEVKQQVNQSVEIIQEDNYYKDDNIEIKISYDTYLKTKLYIATVSIKDISYLKTAFAKDTYGKNITDVTSKIAKDHSAIFAVNGDFYGVQEKGFVLKNYEIYRTSKKSDQEDLVIYKDGSFEIIEEKNTNINKLYDAKEILSFGPGLIKNSNIIVGKNDEVKKARLSNPRTAIGITKTGEYLFIVSDGRTKQSKGLSLYELAFYMQEKGVINGYNLDGGGSSTMYFNGKVLNKPTHDGKNIKERSVSDIVYIGY